MIDLDKYQASKKVPTQTRGKERVRQILLAASKLFAERGVASVTTNDIADRAHMPIGSVYSYYEDKNAIIAALDELYHTELIAIIDQLSDNPMLRHMNEFEVATIVINFWSYYLENNSPLSYVMYARIEPSLRDVASTQQNRLQQAFCRLLHTKDPNRKHSLEPGSPCTLVLLQAMMIVETSDMLYRSDHAARQQFVDKAIPPYCSFIESLR